ncbi:TPA: hypothetical protein DD449_03945 [Candidatus Berkelbacteria bacterium]|uniref:Transcriptional regulator TrmB n=1 Tax=Berkelbacteria bacterium GW2011_GWE1_39_12 TaxID=1618337 RepID=A0A0G4B2S7_9BACT|nr:MAG: transcriptional regulator TrmB [Berkelbacteria bacterium GW2011_GWE1_39_12]HBO60809.1 hypothetical protein [Candidatus Berkelbacteria bacterium]
MDIKIEGLDEEEFHVYKALLSLKRGTVLQLAAISGEKRSNLYRILDNLMAKRLVSEIYEGKKHFYIAESPKVLMDFINQQKERISEIIPELETIEKEALERPKIKFYEGKNGIKNLYDELIMPNQEILAFAWPDKLLDKIDFHNEFVKTRLKHNMPVRAIYPDNRAARLRNTGLKESKYSKKLPAFDATMLISGNKVVLFSMKNWITGVLIDNKEIADCLKALFDGYWGELKK